MRLTAKVTTNTGAWKSAVQSAADVAGKALANQMYNDSMAIVPKDQGTLRNVGRVESGDGPGEYWLVWATVYALYQWFGVRADGTHRIRRHTTPGTSTAWVDKAKEKCAATWQAVAQNAFTKGLK